jgi:glutamine amidotransferase
MITIIDYGLGNIKAFGNIYNKLNIPFIYANKPEQLNQATKIILPGVGAFDHAMTLLNKSGMREKLDELVLEKNVPVIGICVGMQMMACSSDEGKLPGLGWIKGTVKKFNLNNTQTCNQYPLPHMGWNILNVQSDLPLLKNLGDTPRFYFLHSYYFECADAGSSIATADYDSTFTCSINSGNAYGIQCHPEKSHQAGIQLLKNFAEL